MIINWVELDEIQEGKGHGIELHHEDFPRGKMIAFIDGFAWKHKTSDETTVEILKPSSKLLEENAINGTEIINELKAFITLFVTGKRIVKEGKKLGKKPKKIKLWVNG